MAILGFLFRFDSFSYIRHAGKCCGVRLLVCSNSSWPSVKLLCISIIKFTASLHSFTASDGLLGSAASQMHRHHMSFRGSPLKTFKIFWVQELDGILNCVVFHSWLATFGRKIENWKTSQNHDVFKGLGRQTMENTGNKCNKQTYFDWVG